MDDARLDDLYGAPLDRFVTARNLLARELREAGETDEAAGVAALRKPSLAAWALNQVARSHPEEVARLLEVQAGMQTAGSPAELRTASDERQRLVGALTGAAVAALEEGGHSGAGARDRISMTLLASGTDPGIAEALRLGRLTRDAEPGSSWELSMAATGPASSREKSRSDPVDLDLVRARRRSEELEARARTLEERAERAARDAEEAQRRASALAEEAAAARSEADAQAAALTEMKGS